MALYSKLRGWSSKLAIDIRAWDEVITGERGLRTWIVEPAAGGYKGQGDTEWEATMKLKLVMR
jgi:hypothetical protein